MKVKTISPEEIQGLTQKYITAVILDDEPETGEIYEMVLFKDYTGRQRHLFEKLVKVYYLSGASSYEALNYKSFRNEIKKNLGEGFDRFEYTDDKYKIISVTLNKGDNISDLMPDYVALDFQNGNHERLRGFVKSTKKYSKKDFTGMIDLMIKEMIMTGINSKQFQDILESIGYTE